MLLVWDENAWEDYLWWQAQDSRTLKRINTLLADIGRNGNEGIGKPEALRHDLSGYWSRRITDEHRLVYKIVDDETRIAATTTAEQGGLLASPVPPRKAHSRLDRTPRLDTISTMTPGIDDCARSLPRPTRRGRPS